LGQRQPFSVHSPRHEAGQARSSQAWPRHPSKQEQVPGVPLTASMSTAPWTQPLASVGVSHSGPDQSAEQRHTPGETHWPLPLQSAGQRASSHSSPAHPSKHAHAGSPAAPTSHAPCRLQPSGQRGSAQSCPPHPGTQRHEEGASHAPRPEQLVSHTGWPQSAPDQPSEQAHAPEAPHTPWREQPLGHAGLEQSAPVQPAVQLQLPGARHWPRPWQSLEHCGPRSQASPA
jgi:hypothetical protein